MLLERVIGRSGGTLGRFLGGYHGFSFGQMIAKFEPQTDYADSAQPLLQGICLKPVNEKNGLREEALQGLEQFNASRGPSHSVHLGGGSGKGLGLSGAGDT